MLGGVTATPLREVQKQSVEGQRLCLRAELGECRWTIPITAELGECRWTIPLTPELGKAPLVQRERPGAVGVQLLEELLLAIEELAHGDHLVLVGVKRCVGELGECRRGTISITAELGECRWTISSPPSLGKLHSSSESAPELSVSSFLKSCCWPSRNSRMETILFLSVSNAA